MRVLVACEFSGTVRREFTALGHDAWSCDLLPSMDDSSNHFQCDCLSVLDRGWDLLIAHPDCTYLTNSAEWAYKDPDFARYPSAGYHQKLKPGTLFGEKRREARVAAVKFFLKLWNSGVPKICIENPVGHMAQHIDSSRSQKVQPYQFGDDASKSTCLWLIGLPHLKHTNYVNPRMVNGRPRWANQTDSGQNNLTPGDSRWAVRSVTYKGIAKAMADQWGSGRYEEPSLF